MEPFGILQFLQSLLPSNPNSAPSNPHEGANEKTPDEPSSASQIAEPSDAQDAIIRFIESHDKRAERIKKR